MENLEIIHAKNTNSNIRIQRNDHCVFSSGSKSSRPYATYMSGNDLKKELYDFRIKK